MRLLHSIDGFRYLGKPGPCRRARVLPTPRQGPSCRFRDRTTAPRHREYLLGGSGGHVVLFIVSDAALLMTAGLFAGGGRQGAWALLFSARGLIIGVLAVPTLLIPWHPSVALINVDRGTQLPNRRARRLGCSARHVAQATRGRDRDPIVWIHGRRGIHCPVLSYRADSFVLGAISGTAAVGIFAAAATICESLLLVPDALAPALVLLAGRKSQPRRLFLLATAATVVACGLLSLLLIAVRYPLVELLYGPHYRDVARVLPILLAASTMLAGWKTACSYLIGKGNARFRLFSASRGSSP